jgi:hypothetical protein
MKTRDEIVSLVNHEIASAHLVEDHIEIAYKLGYIQGQNDKENELESESEPTDEGLQALADLGKSNLPRFLPRRPDDVDAPPDGWVYVGGGSVANESKDNSKWIINTNDELKWIEHYRVQGSCGLLHYAVRWTAPADIWHRFGLLSPYKGGGWIPHTPGDPLPCNGDISVDCLRADCETLKNRHPMSLIWSKAVLAGMSIIGWRPSLAEVRS